MNGECYENSRLLFQTLARKMIWLCIVLAQVLCPKVSGIVINFIILGSLGHELLIRAIYFYVEFPGLILLNSKGLYI